MTDSIQHRIGRNRPPRVQITYDVETGGAIKKKELPFVVGIMADLSMPEGDAHPIPLTNPQRKFVEIDRDNFAAYLASLSPKVSGKAPDGAWDLEITSMDDFSPKNLVKKIKGLDVLYERRQAIRELLTKLDSNDDARELLSKIYLENGLPGLIEQATSRAAALTGSPPTTQFLVPRDDVSEAKRAAEERANEAIAKAEARAKVEKASIDAQLLLDFATLDNTALEKKNKIDEQLATEADADKKAELQAKRDAVDGNIQIQKDALAKKAAAEKIVKDADAALIKLEALAAAANAIAKANEEAAQAQSEKIKADATDAAKVAESEKQQAADALGSS